MHLPTNYVLIDLENVQPKNLSILKGHQFRILVFVGENQTKVPFDLASAMQSFGEDAQYIQIDGNGKNALDFHIAFYLGELKSKDPEGFFHIISKDKGFDPLVKHIRKNKRRINRHSDLAEIPLLRISKATNIDEKLNEVVKNLKGRGQSRPRKVKTLTNTINSLLTEKMNEKEMISFLAKLEEMKIISILDDKVTYNFKI
jgi:hypothetical protein